MAVTPAQRRQALLARSALEQEQAARDALRLREQVQGVVTGMVPSHARCWLIGSLAWGGFGERSDIDLVFEGLEDAQVTQVELAVAAATKMAVDPLRIEELPPEFATRVRTQGIALHGAAR